MQTEFDWTRAEQLGMVERWTPPRVPGVSASAMKYVLRSIDSYGRGREAWPSEMTLARDCGLGVRTVKRAVKALGALSLLVVERRGPSTVNHYRIVWTELALRCSEASGKSHERSAMVTERSAIVTERSAMVALREVPPWHPKRQGSEKETTTTANDDVVVVSLGKYLGKAERAAELARARGQSDEWIMDRLREWQELPAASRDSGKLYNWLAMEGSYRSTGKLSKANYGRGDGLRRDQVAGEALRMRIVRAGRAAGATQEQIDGRLKRAGV